MRHNIPIVVTLIAVLSFFHKSYYPFLFGRYSFKYLIFLMMMVIGSITAWKVALNKERYARLCSRVRRIPLFPAIITGGCFVVLLAVFLEDTQEFMGFITPNITVFGIFIVGILTLAMSSLSGKKVFTEASNHALMMVSILISFCFVEIGLRYKAYRDDSKLLSSLDNTVNKPRFGESVPFGRMIRLSSNPRVIYELIPDLSVVFLGQPVTTNSRGFRGKEVTVDKTGRIIRLLGIGDSVMFGWGVRDDEAYLTVLSNMLNETHPQFSWEVVNTAVPGYNTVMEVETLKEKGLAYHPDVVLVDFVINDLDLPNFIRKKENYFTLRKSFLRQFVAKLSQADPLPEGLTHAPFDVRGGHFENKPENVPDEYSHMVGKDAFRQAMEELKALGEEHGFIVIVLSHWDLPVFVKTMCQELGFGSIEVLPVWERYVFEHRVVDPTSAWQLSNSDPHPTALGHRVIAKAIFDHLTDQKIIQRLKSKKR